MATKKKNAWSSDAINFAQDNPELTKSLSTNPDAWKEIASIPGAYEVLSDNPDLMAEVIKDPQSALDQYYGRDTKSSPSSMAGDAGSAFNANTPVVMPERGTVEQFGLVGTPADEVAGVTESVDPMLANIDASFLSIEANINAMNDVNKSLLAGEIPSDVSAQVRRMASESSGAKGLGTGLASQNLTARDLGLTSAQIQQQGLQNQQAIVGLQQGTTGLKQESVKLREGIREFNESYKLQVSQLKENQRQFNDTYKLQTQAFLEDIRKTDLSAVALEQERQMFNAQMNTQTLSYIVSMTNQAMQTQFDYSKEGLDSAALITSVDNMISSINDSLEASMAAAAKV